MASLTYKPGEVFAMVLRFLQDQDARRAAAPRSSSPAIAAAAANTRARRRSTGDELESSMIGMIGNGFRLGAPSSSVVPGAPELVSATFPDPGTQILLLQFDRAVNWNAGAAYAHLEIFNLGFEIFEWSSGPITGNGSSSLTVSMSAIGGSATNPNVLQLGAGSVLNAGDSTPFAGVSDFPLG